jgi:2-keto-4-pentenoate hydratase/2-oxohepta-3-ene-1,7-dioic acid hydratase in catechol pathway
MKTLTHHQQAVVTGFTFANDVTARALSIEHSIAVRAFRYDEDTAVRATLRLREASLVADWFGTNGFSS